MQSVIAAEPVLRLGVFLGVLVVMAVWEALVPGRPQAIGRGVRWPNNLALVAVNTLVVRVLVPFSGVAMAALAEGKGWGLFNAVAVPAWVAVPASLVLLDLVIFGQHRAFHAAPLLWRLHRVHHADLEFDVTTGLRFHPGEILLSAGIKLAAIVALGASALAVLVFEVLLNASSMFNHANVRLTPRIEGMVRAVIVTPDMHRVHHSIDRRETDSNFGFNLSCWDRLFGTYLPQPALGHDGMVLGIEQFRAPRELGLDRMLAQPLRGDGDR